MAAITRPVEVIHLGGAREEYFAYDDTEAFSEGDLVRLSLDEGTIALAEADSAGAVHGIALEDGTTAGDAVKVLLFAADTIIKIQCTGTVAPEDLKAGSAYTIVTTTKAQAITSTKTNGILKVVKTSAVQTPWEIARGAWDDAAATDNNTVLAQVLQSVLDGAVNA
jgi:hypothetical protein